MSGCECHDHILLSTSDPQKRHKLMVEAGCPSGSCMWQGRRAVELALGGVESMRSKMRTYQSSILKVGLSKCSPAVSADKLRAATGMVEQVSTYVSFKFKPMFCELPGSLVGLFGESRGFSRDVVHRHAAALCAEHDSRIDKSSIHRVEKYYFDSASPLRQQIDNALEMRNAFSDFPLLDRELEGHALALITGSSTEGLHRSIHANMLRSINALPGLACARNRSPEVNSLSDCTQFLAFCFRRWNSRGSNNSLNCFLSSFIPTHRLNLMSARQKFERIYGYDLDSQFTTQDEYKDTIKQMKQYIKDRRVAAVPLTNVESQIVNFIRSALPKGSCFVMPECYLAPAAPVNVYSEAKLIDDMVACIDNIEKGVGECPLDKCLLEVVLPNTTCMVQVPLAHQAPCNTTFHCRKYNISEASDGTISCSMASGVDCVIDLRRWTSDVAFLTFLRSAKICNLSSSKAVLAIKPALAEELALGMYPAISEVNSDALSLLDLVDEQDAIVAHEESASCGDEFVLACRSNDAISSFLEQGAIDSEPIEQWFSSDSISAEQLHEFETLVSRGVLKASPAETDAGVVRFAIKANAVQYESFDRFTTGSPIMSLTNFEETNSAMPKLALFACLLQRGWEVRPALGAFVDAESSPHVSASLLSKPKWMIFALTQAKSIFLKLHNIGQTKIPLTMPSGYYQALCKLQDLSPLCALGDELASTAHAEFLKICKEAPSTEADELAIENVAEAEADALVVLEDFSAPAAHDGGDALFASKYGVKITGPRRKPLQVRFDNWTHSSGMQRVYLCCPYHKDERCDKYSFVHLHESPREAAIWTLAWGFAGARAENGPKEVHLATPPSAIDLEWARTKIPPI